MSKVLKVDVSGLFADAYATKSLTLSAPFYLSYRWAVSQATLTNLTSRGGDEFCAVPVNFSANTGDGFLGVDFGSTGSWKFEGDFDPSYGSGSAAGSLPGDTWVDVSMAYDGTDITWKVGGVTLFTYPLSSADLDSPIQVGATFVPTVSGTQVYYIDDIKIGTTVGGSDIFAEDFESGTLAGFDSTTNSSALSIIDDPFGPPVADFTLAASPDTLTVAHGVSGDITITGTLVSGSDDTAALSSSGEPAGVTVTFSPYSVDEDGGTSTMHIAVGCGAPAGTYTLTVSGVDSDETQTATVTLTVADRVTTVTGTLLGTETFPDSEFGGLGDTIPYLHHDLVPLTVDAPAATWVIVTAVGAQMQYSDLHDGASEVLFPNSSPGFLFALHPAFANTVDLPEGGTGQGMPEWNSDHPQFLGHAPWDTEPWPSPDPTVFYSQPGLIAGPMSSGDDITLEWDLEADKSFQQPYIAFAVAVDAPLLEDTSFPGRPVQSGQQAADPATGTTFSVDIASFGDPGTGALLTVAIAWNDQSLTPTISSGWTTLGSYADTTGEIVNPGGTPDSTVGWGAILLGRLIAAGDSSTYTATATFSSSVHATGISNAWETCAGSQGLHIWHRT